MKTLRVLSLWAPVIGFVILTQHLASPRVLPDTSGQWDKLLHMAAYGLFGLACMRAFHGGLTPPRRRPTWLALGLVLGYGLVDELRQATIPGRIASSADWVADAFGGLLALAGVSWYCRRRDSPKARGDGS